MEAVRSTSGPAGKGVKWPLKIKAGREKNHIHGYSVAMPWIEGKLHACAVAVEVNKGASPAPWIPALLKTLIQQVSKLICSQFYNIKCLCLVNRTTNTCDFVVNRAVRILSTSWECVIFWLAFLGITGCCVCLCKQVLNKTFSTQPHFVQVSCRFLKFQNE